MKLNTWLVFVFGAVFWPVGLVFSQEASIVRITQVDGTLLLRKSDSKEWAAAREGQILERGDAVQCQAGSTAILSWSNGSLVKLYPEAALTLAGVSFELDKRIEKSILNLERGRIFAKGQVPEHLFAHFEVRMGFLSALTQGAEFALHYDEKEERATVWVLHGQVVTEIGTELVRIPEGNQASWKASQKELMEAVVPLSQKTNETLAKTSADLGGSLLVEQESSQEGPLQVKIGGVTNRRGSAPYKVKFKAILRGGSGKVKRILWDFGDGETSEEREAEHTFTQGVYTVIIRVEDATGQKRSAQINISAEEECKC